MKTINLLTTTLLSIFLMACNEKQNQSPIQFDPGVSFDLAHDDTANCSCEGLSITFTDVVEDSRCPTGVICVWEGQARVQLDVQTDHVSQSIELLYRVTKSSWDRDTVGNYAISLVQLSPHPREGGTLDKEDYSIKLMVEEL